MTTLICIHRVIYDTNNLIKDDELITNSLRVVSGLETDVSWRRTRRVGCVNGLGNDALQSLRDYWFVWGFTFQLKMTYPYNDIRKNSNIAIGVTNKRNKVTEKDVHNYTV